MRAEQVSKILTDKGLDMLKVNSREVCVNSLERNNEVFVLLHFEADDPILCNGTMVDRKVMNFSDKIKAYYLERGLSPLILTIVYTRRSAELKEVCAQIENCWIVDQVFNRLMILENQPADFIGMHQIIEDILLNEDKYTAPAKRENNNVPYCTIAIIAVTVISYFILSKITIGDAQVSIMWYGGLNWSCVINSGEYYRLITYMFFHGSISHLSNNMIVLFFTGGQVEQAVKPWKLLIIYFASGIVAGIVSIVYNMNIGGNTISIGASGAVFGIMGALAYILFINRGKLPGISTGRIMLFIGLALYNGFTSQGIDNAAHIGGVAAGILLGAVLYRKGGRRA